MQEDYWYLEGYFSGNARVSRLPVNHFPFQIGRDTSLDFIVPSNNASRVHAIISLEGRQLVLRDNHSTNGTFVNRQKLEGAKTLQHGDILHFADFEVRVIRDIVEQSVEPTLSMAALRMENLSQMMPAGVRELQEMLAQRQVRPLFQPIVMAGSRAIYAYEVLGRGLHPNLSPNPGPLFRIAESLEGHAVTLSQLFRETGLELVEAQPDPSRYRFFLNIHPDELRDPTQLLNHLDGLRQQFPHLPLVLEIHEKAVTDIDNMKHICSGLDALNIELAYDDFGAGQARFIELIEAPSHYLKFDISLVANLDTAPESKRNIVKMLVQMSHDMGIRTLAEGLDRLEEVQACEAIGFDFIQGFYCGRPQERIH